MLAHATPDGRDARRSGLPCAAIYPWRPVYTRPMVAPSDTSGSPLSSPASVADVVAAEGGRVTLARFMQLALTHPTLGYYSQADNPLGRRGDFSTAPTLSPFFNETVARLLTELVAASLQTSSPQTACPQTASSLDVDPAGGGLPATNLPGAQLCVVELGGGRGDLAAAILSHWECEHPEWRGKVGYRIVEVSKALREAQMAGLRPWTTAGWDVAWVSGLAETGSTARPVVVLANEFLDALPVHLVDVRAGDAREAYVCAGDDRCKGPEQSGGPERSDVTGTSARSDPESRSEPGSSPELSLTWDVLSEEAKAEMESIFGTADATRLRPLTHDGILELRPEAASLVRQVAELMPSGSLLNIDYGDWLPGIVEGTANETKGGSVEAGGAAAGSAAETRGGAGRRRSLRGYYRHHLVADPLARPGLQDLTADVDFAALDLAGRREGFETVLYTSLSKFLRAGGAEQELRRLTQSGSSTGDAQAHVQAPPHPDISARPLREGFDPLEADRQATVLRALLDETDLGGAFKLVLQVKD